MVRDEEPSEVLEEEECICTPKEKVAKQALKGLPCTCPYDPRFPNTDQTDRCIVNFVDYQRCTRLLGDYQGCRIFKLCYTELCPIQWVKTWTEEIKNGNFPPTIYPSKQNDTNLPDESQPFDTAGY